MKKTTENNEEFKGIGIKLTRKRKVECSANKDGSSFKLGFTTKDKTTSVFISSVAAFEMVKQMNHLIFIKDKEIPGYVDKTLKKCKRARR